MLKVYSITFNQYTNSQNDTVWCKEDNTYINVGTGAFLIFEDEIDKYMRYGDGIKHMTLAGYMQEYNRNDA